MFTCNGLQCTGTMLNNDQHDGRGYFLTAFHCLDKNENGQIDASEQAALSQAAFTFQYWRNSCSGSTMNNKIVFSGAILRAKKIIFIYMN